jgi:hypothetical protein
MRSSNYGKPFEEPTLLRIAEAFEQATEFRNRRPAMAEALAAA